MPAVPCAGAPCKTLAKLPGLAWLGYVFAFLTSIAAFGIGNMVQANSVAEAASSSYGITPMVTGLVLVVLTAAVILGGIHRIAEVTQSARSVYVPPVCHRRRRGAGADTSADIEPALALVFDSAFTDMRRRAALPEPRS